MIKMRPLFELLALLLFLCLVHSCTGDAGSQTVEVFKGKNTKVSYKTEDGKPTERTPIAFRIPAFVGGIVNQKEFLAIICGAYFNGLSDNITVDGIIKTSYNNHNQWTEPEGFTNNTQGSAKHIFMGDFTAVMKENKIYVLATSYNTQGTVHNTVKPHNPCDPVMFVGTVTDSTSSGVSSASITWGEGKSLKDGLSQSAQEELVSKLVGGIGNGIVTKNGSIVFPIRIFQKNEQMTSSILYSINNGTTWTIGGMAGEQTNDGSVVEWGEEKLLLIVSSSEGFRKVFESKDMGASWTESVVLSRVWGNDPKRTDYIQQGSAIKVSVDGKDMLLIVHPLSKSDGSSPDTLQLWLSDGQRIVLVGTISEKNKGQKTGNSLLAHVGDHLYVTHEINPPDFSTLSATQQKDGGGVIGLTPLPKFFESAKNTARAWHNLDKKYKTKGISVETLVGFLVNGTSNDVWEDMYNCVNATVKNGEIVDGGFRFNGAANSGAEWRVSSQGENQVYAFAKKQFTLAATVTIHTAEGKGTEKFPLIGASLTPPENNVFIGLGYTNDNKWYAESHSEKELTTNTEKFKSDNEYHIAITFANGKAVVYVDGVEITKEQITITGAASISHFFMGGAGKSSSGATDNSCTVKNVMLFSRALEKKEMEELSKISKNANLHTPIPTEEPTSEPEISSAALTTNAQNAQHLHKTDSKVEVKSVPEIPDTKKTMKPTHVPDGSKSLSTKKPQQTSVTNKQEIIKEITKINGVEHSLPNHPNGTPEKHLQGADTAAVAFCIMPFMCFVCSVIVLAGL